MANLYHQDYHKFIEDLKTYHNKKWKIGLATNKEKELQQLFEEKKLGNVDIEYWPFVFQLNGFINEKEKIVLKRKIYHNGRQYIVKIPKEIITHIGFNDEDMIEYTLVISPEKDKPELKIKYVGKNGRTKR